jgi:hypothetical protein
MNPGIVIRSETDADMDAIRGRDARRVREARNTLDVEAILESDMQRIAGMLQAR